MQQSSALTQPLLWESVSLKQERSSTASARDQSSTASMHSRKLSPWPTSRWTSRKTSRVLDRARDASLARAPDQSLRTAARPPRRTSKQLNRSRGESASSAHAERGLTQLDRSHGESASSAHVERGLTQLDRSHGESTSSAHVERRDGAPRTILVVSRLSMPPRRVVLLAAGGLGAAPSRPLKIRRAVLCLASRGGGLSSSPPRLS